MSPPQTTTIWHITATNYSGKAMVIRWQLKNELDFQTDGCTTENV